MIPLATPSIAFLKSFFLLWRHALGKNRDDRTDNLPREADPKRGSLGNEKATSADANKQYDNGGNLKPSHFLAHQDQPATKIVPRAPMMVIAVSLST